MLSLCCLLWLMSNICGFGGQILPAGRKSTRRTGSWPSCCTPTSAWPPAARTPSRQWWTHVPHSWRTLNNMNTPQSVDRTRTEDRHASDLNSVCLSGYLFIYLFLHLLYLTVVCAMLLATVSLCQRIVWFTTSLNLFIISKRVCVRVSKCVCMCLCMRGTR